MPVADVDRYPLHPGFAASWRSLRPLLSVRPAVVVDAANVVGSVPDGWWNDRAGAAARLLDGLAERAGRGTDAGALGLPESTWFPEITVVLEGEARAADDVPGVAVVRATGSGDDAIVAEAGRLRAAGRQVTVVTSDRGLRDRLPDAAVRPVSWLRDLA